MAKPPEFEDERGNRMVAPANDNYYNPYNYVHQEVEDLSSARWERIKKAVFYDEDLPNNVYGRQSMIRKLAEPSRSLRRAIVDLLSIQKEHESLALVDLIEVMNGTDDDARGRAAQHVYAISRLDGSIASRELIDALIRVTRSGDPDAQRAAVGALSHLSDKPEGQMYIFRSGGLAEIIRMLRSDDESVVRYALTTLHRLLLHVEPSRKAARDLHATDALTLLLEGSRPHRLLAMAADSVYLLMIDFPQERNKFAIDLDGARRLVHLLTTFEDQPKVIYTTVRCLRALSGGQESAHLKHVLIEKDALIVLYSNLVRMQDTRTRIAILACLRNLSDAVSNEQDHSALLIVLLNIVSGSPLSGGSSPITEDEVMYACGVLSNLTCNNVNNKAAVCESNGVATLVDTLRVRPNASDEAVSEPALCALRHCTARHQQAAHAQRALVRAQGWEMLLDQLQTLRPPVAKAALGVARNAALLSENRNTLVELPGGIGEKMAAICVELLKSAAVELRVDVRATSDDGVSMWELAEAAAGALHQLAAHSMIAEWMLADPALLQIVKEILESDEASIADEVMQRELLGLLYQTTKLESGIIQVESLQVQAVVSRCLQSPHSSVVTYATGVLRNMGISTPHGEHGAYARDESGYGNPNWDGNGSRNEYQMGEGYEPELFGYHNAGLQHDTYGLERIDQFRLPHNNSDWFDTDL